MFVVSLMFTCSLPLLLSQKVERLVYNNLSAELVFQAREFGQAAYSDFLNATSESSVEERIQVYEDFFIKCNKLGIQQATDVQNAVNRTSTTLDHKLLLTMGLQPFVSKFFTMPLTDINSGIQQLCTRFEMQLQCQLGFGESRAQILSRIEDLKLSSGNLKLLLERDCVYFKNNSALYHCIGSDVRSWSKPCYQEMLAYNYTRYSAGRRIARLHLKVISDVEALTKHRRINTEDEIFPFKFEVQSKFVRELKKIAEVEAEKCAALLKVLNCVLPELALRCGSEAAIMMRTSVLVGYLSRERREQLSNHFRGFDVESHPICTALDPLI